MLLKELEDKITSITPQYDNTVLGGHFIVTFGTHVVFNLSFPAFLKRRFEEDQKLKDYVRNRKDDAEISASGIVRDLYSIGCPMEEWIEDYFTNVRSKVSQFDALLQLFNHLKSFGDDNTK
jgi:hypothetical protein